MTNRIIFVQGSPRKNANTRAATAIAIASAKESGAEVAEIDVINLDFKAPGCVGCQKCQQSEAFECAFNDEVAQNMEKASDYLGMLFSFIPFPKYIARSMGTY